jgi:ribose transport system substrate-binding protein
MLGCSKSSPTPSGGSRPAQPKQRKPTVAFVTNGIASFWVIAEAGARAAAKDFDANVEVRMPPADGAVANQKRMLEELLTLGVDGIAVSPIDPDNQADILNECGSRSKMITHDSDAPKTNRLAYVGMDNYTAGRMCGQLVKQAIPDGGSVMLFVGRLEQLNAKLRRQGVIDELLDRSHDPARYDPPGAVLGEGGKYVVLDTRTDNFDFAAAKSLAEDAIARYPDLGCMVGLFAYNPPYMLEALKGANKQGKIRLVGFDEADETLQAIVDGHCFGTVVQNPYMYGYESVRILTGLARGDQSVMPQGGFLDIPARQITHENVQQFWDELKSMIAGTAAKPSGTGGPLTPALSPKGRGGEGGGTAKSVRVSFVTNNVSDFWKIAHAGVRKAEKEFGVACDFRMPHDGTPAEQQRIVEDLIASGVDGLAISPNDAENQTDLLNRAADATKLICHDSDAPKSRRLAYVGTNNYNAGRAAGRLIKEVLPNGGKIMLFVGRMDAQNAIDRSRGIKDELAGSSPPIQILDIRTDLTDRARAKGNVEDTLAQHPDIGCLVGLWSYNGPAILEAVKDAGKAGKTPIVCFDEEDATLQGVKDGHIHATVVQQPFEFGYHSVRILAALARGDSAVIPETKLVEIPVQVVRRDNVDEFWQNLKRLKGGQ